MMQTGIVPMTAELASQAASWRYPGEYAVYNCDEGGDPGELLDGGSYGVLNSSRELIGFYQFGAGARIPTVEENAYPDGPLDMGLGMRPDLCGLGLGTAFVGAGIRFAQESLSAGKLRLTVAGFNLRAQKVYERCGFTPTGSVTHRATGGDYVIMLMD